MNKQDAGRVMATIAAGFPGTTIGADTAEVWHRAALADISFEEGMAIAQELLTDPNREMPHSFPKLTEVQRIRRRRVKAAQEEFTAERALAAAPAVSREQAKANVRRLRETLEAAQPIKTVRKL
jgi:hypothetical protein